MGRRARKRLLADVENLAEAVVETIEQLHAVGLARHAATLERALARLAGSDRTDDEARAT